MATKTASSSPTTNSHDVEYITDHPHYAQQVARVNDMIRHYRDIDGSINLPATFPNETQHKAMVRMHQGKDVMISFKTGGGKTLCFVMAPMMTRQKLIYSFVTPLRTIQDQHEQTLLDFGYPRSIIHTMTESNVVDIVQVIRDHDWSLPLFILGSPEAFTHEEHGLYKLLPKSYRKKLGCLMIDEVQLILDWGVDFREAFARLILYRKLNSKQRVVTASGSTATQERTDLASALELSMADVLVGPLARMDLRLDVLLKSSISNMHPRILPEEKQQDETKEEESSEEDEDSGEDSDDEELAKAKGRDQLKLSILDHLRKYPNKGFVVHCESTDHCINFAKALNDYLSRYGSDAVALPLYRKAPKWMAATLEFFNDPDNPCRVLCCTVVLGMGVNAQCNNQPVHGAFIKRLLSNLSMTKQFIDRSHRGYAHDPTSFGVVVIQLDLQDYRRHMMRAFALQGSTMSESQHGLGKRLELASNTMFSLFMNPSHCLQLAMNAELGGADKHLQCTGSVHDCCNCHRRKTLTEKAQRTRTNGCGVMRSDATIAAKRAVVRSMTATYLVPSNKTSRPSVAGWTKMINLFPPTIQIPASITKVTIKVMVDNTSVTKLLQKLVKQVLRNKRYGIPFAKLVKQVEIGTGKFGLTNAQTRWCLTCLLFAGILEEEEDASPAPIGFERTKTQRRKMHTKLTHKGLEMNEWPKVMLHEQLGFFL